MRPERRLRGWRLGSFAVLAGVASGCGGPKPYVRADFLSQPPRRVAVLPFVITYPYDRTDEQGIPSAHATGRDVLRRTLYYALTPYGYEDLPLAEVDRRLVSRWGPVEEETWRRESPQTLGGALGVDALIYGEIKRLMHFSTPLYTETSLEASLWMADASSGEVLWRQRVKAAERGGAVMKKGQVVDFIKDQVRSANAGVKFLRVSDVAVRQALKGLPNPPMPAEAGSSGQPPDAVGGGGTGARLAILPLQARREQWRKPAQTLRMYLTASAQETPFEVLEIQRVDAALEQRGWRQGEPLQEDLSLAELAQALDADAFLRGALTNWGRTYLAVQSWVKAELQLELIDAPSGEVIWSERKKNTRQAGILKGPTGYKSIVTAPLMGLKSSHIERVANHLAREMIEDLRESPAVLAYVDERQ